MKTCLFINLAGSHDRRRAVEASFAATAEAGWRLKRFEARSPADVVDIPGGLLPTEKACFASHRLALESVLDDEDPVLIVEDDTAFSHRTFQVLDAFLSHFPDWDVVFADVAVCDFASMVLMASRRDRMVAGGEFKPLDLGKVSWTSASAYAVRGSAKRKLHAALSGPAALDQPYDVFLAGLAHSGQVRIASCFPFLTAPSAAASVSQIQASRAPVFDSTLNAFRRLMWIDRDLDACRRDAEALRSAYDDDTAVLASAIFGAIVSPAFPIEA